MTTIKRLTDSCLVVTDSTGTTVFDPGFYTYDHDYVDLNELGDVQRVLISHEHGDHVSPGFVRWLVDRGTDVKVYSNQAVASLLEQHGIDVLVDDPVGITSEDVTHEVIPNGTSPPNRSYTIEGVLTHPGDSYGPTTTAPVLALPLLTPWGTTTKSVEFARRLGPKQVVPIHDFYLSEGGRAWITGMAKSVLSHADIELVPLDWGQAYTI
ncbi:MAG: MBL fold metallo-hydrolase [Acidimicrobiia bacterium]|nr:MBL fold metallo-hydrolase [Acidimicrobiia bacterium]